MHDMTFGALSFAGSRARRRDQSEPRLYPGHARLPPENDAVAEADPLSETATEVLAFSVPPNLRAPGARMVPGASGQSAGPLFYLALGGLVAVLTGGAFFGAGFLLPAPPQRAAIATAAPKSVTTSPAPVPKAPVPAPEAQASAARASVPASTAALAASSPAPAPKAESPAGADAAARLAQSPPTERSAANPQHAATSKPAPVTQITAAEPQRPQPSANAPAPRVTTAPTQRALPAATGPTDVAIGMTQHSPPERPVATSSVHVRRVAHAHWQHHYRHARYHSVTPTWPRVAQSGARSEEGQTQAFDQLLTQLTGSGKTADRAGSPPSLTPPAPGQPNPFDRR